MTTECCFTTPTARAGEMCGNGARCICRYGYEIGLAGELQRVETTAGLVTGGASPGGSIKSNSTGPPPSGWTTPWGGRQDLSLLLCGAGEIPICPTQWFRFRTARPAGGGAVRPWGQGPTPPSPRAQMSISSMWRDRGADLGAHL